MSGYKGLAAYKRAYELAFDIFRITKNFPAEEKYSLTTQMRRSSDQFVQILPKHTEGENTRLILSKLSDCESENSETEVWIDFSKDCAYIDEPTYKNLFALNTLK